eukprot:TRINITY_DN44028_c0_g1_i1.p1 TRINITY_DN44028_c0_g1~~TRINITY_DN44028_c0_g1_i1.p1  ORF type:complete len:357 (-),score=50.02 TRINITY_DN44028_c0_g1_i1:52-1122(-)
MKPRRVSMTDSQFMRATLLSPPLGAQHSQRRWDTSPYRRSHLLTWKRLQKCHWPQVGSLAWRPEWGTRQPPVATPEELGLFDGGSIAPRRGGVSELLHRRIAAKLNLGSAAATALIQRGFVNVNERRTLKSRWVSEFDDITVNGHELNALADLALLANKPSGYALTEEDPLFRRTYTSLLPDPTLIARPVSRLDFKASGLLVLTNRRDIAQILLGVESNIPVSFILRPASPLQARQLALLDQDATYGDDVRIMETDTVNEENSFDDNVPMVPWPSLRLTVSGHGVSPRALRRGFAAAGAATPLAIRCVGFGPLRIDGHSDSGDGSVGGESVALQPGEARHLTAVEIAAVLKFAESR